MKRQSFKVEAYDCRINPCGRGGCVPGNPQHGGGAERWVYAVSDGDVAVSLEVHTGIYLTEHDTAYALGGSDISVHTAFPTEREIIRDGAEGHECGYVDGGRCFIFSTTALGANTFFEKHGNLAQFEQSEAFWVGLEEYLKAQRALAYAARTDTKHVQCPTCGGCGTVEKR